MIYSLIKQKFGTSKLDPVFNIDLNYKIVDLCHVPDLGYIFVCEGVHALGYVDDNGSLVFPWAGNIENRGCQEGYKEYARFNMPSSLSYCKELGVCYVIDNNGRGVRSVDVRDGYVSAISNKNRKKDFKRILDGAFISTSSTNDTRGKVYWTISDLNKVFSIEDSEVYSLAGSGHSSFSVSNRLDKCSFNKPQGIKYTDGAIYVCDSGNKCIRRIKNGSVKIIAGSPDEKSLLGFPTRLKIKNNIGYLVDKDEIKYFSFGNSSIGTVYKSKKIIDIEISEKKDLYILEGDNEV